MQLWLLYRMEITAIAYIRALGATALGQFRHRLMNVDDLTVKFSNVLAYKLTENWTWLIGTDKIPGIVSAIGNMFLKDTNEKIFWLDVGQGKFEIVCDRLQDFEEKLKNIEQVNERYMIDLTTALRLFGKELNDGQLYSYKKLPIIGGDYTVDNFEPTDIEVHFCFAGQIFRQIKDLLDGTIIDKIKFVN